MKKLPISLVCGVAAMLVTILLYIVLLPNVILQGICLVTLFGVLLAEAIVTLFAYMAKGAPRRVAAAVVAAILIPYALLLSIVYIANFSNGYGTYLAWYFAGLLVIGTIAVILSAFEGKRAEENDALQSAKGHMMALRNLVKCVMANPAAAPYLKELVAIEEQLHFANDSIIAPQDVAIESLLTDLMNQIADPDADIKGILTNLRQTIETRAIVTKHST